MLGLWMPDTLSSPLADVVTFSFIGLPSDPGAPFGHRGISAGRSAAAEVSTARAITTLFMMFINRLQSGSGQPRSHAELPLIHKPRNGGLLLHPRRRPIDDVICRGASADVPYAVQLVRPVEDDRSRTQALPFA